MMCVLQTKKAHNKKKLLRIVEEFGIELTYLLMFQMTERMIN